MRLEGLTREKFGEMLNEFIGDCLTRKGKERAELFTAVMDTARSYGLEDQARYMAQAMCEKWDEPELWELPRSFDSTLNLPKLTDDCLPPKLWEYLQAVSKYVQVAPEMGVLPMLSVLSMCVQGKAEIAYPANAHTEPLNIYALTIAAPGERKSGCFKEFIRPVNEYQMQKNESLRLAIRDYKTKKNFLERQRDNAMKGQKADLKKAQELDRQLAELKEVHELKLYVKDSTPEALAGELASQGERLAILDDEGTVFDVLTGLYSTGQSNINILLEAYDGTPYTISRKTSEDITLYNPLISVALMVQPAHYADAMNNRQFSGRGFIHRFMFSFPETMTGRQSFHSPNVDLNLSEMYSDLVTSLLAIPYPQEKVPMIYHSREAEILFEDYFGHLQKEMQKDGKFANMKEWASKQFARALRVAGIFHMAENKGLTDEPLSGQTASYAIMFSLWEEEQARAALSGDGTESEVVKNAKIIVEKLKKLEVDEISKSEIMLKKYSRLKSNDLQEALELLADLNYIRLAEANANGPGRSKKIVIINPNIFFDID
jgi:hypothetical protein